jgi:hypothetical protein
MMSSGALLTEHLPQRPGSRVRHVNRKVIHVHVRAVNLYVERAEIQAHHFTPTRHSNDGNALHCRRFGMHRREVGQGPLGDESTRLHTEALQRERGAELAGVRHTIDAGGDLRRRVDG